MCPSREDAENMAWIQKDIALRPYSRGFHLITDQITAQVPEIERFAVGIVNLFIQHTSASLSLGECVEPEVRADLESFFDRIVPENPEYYTHTYEGPDDMPAHIKSTMTGSSVQIPISDGRLNLGTWQGIYLCEFRNHGGARKLVLTITS